MHLLTLLVSSLSVVLADPYFVVHSINPALSSAPPEVTGRKLEQWHRSQSQSVTDAWLSYLDADPTKHAHAHAEMIDFAATATQWASKLPEWATATGTWREYEVVTETPAWFSDLPKDVQSIKLEEGDVWAAILEGKGYSQGAAPRETGRAALGVLAGVAVAAAML